MMAPAENTAVSRTRPSDAVPGYRLEGMVGRGGMGEVHRATQLSLDRTVAIKLLSTHLVQDESFVARFEKEAAALASLSHPNVVSIVDKGKADDTYYLVMEYVDGPSLRELMRSPVLHARGPVGPLRVILEICRAVEYAHGRGVIHRDLKPENILFDEQAGNIPKVTDFGLADFVDGRGPTHFNVTHTHMGMGTASYMAPEQRVDAKNADQRADIYSLGVILYEVLTGDLPVGHFTPVSQKKPGVDRRVDGIISRCLRPDPSERYSRVADLISELEPLVPAGTSSLRKPTRAEMLQIQLRRSASWAWRIGAGVLVALAACILLVAYMRNQLPPDEESPGEALTLETLPRGEALMGRWAIGGDDYRLGAGRDALPLHPYGRPASLEKAAIVFPPPSSGGPGMSGRVGPDLAGSDAQGLRFTAELTQMRAPESMWRRFKHLLRGTEQRPRAALMLLGHPGRYVALVAPEEGVPLSLEWKLGERAGTMIGPEVSAEGQKLKLELRMNGLGELRAFVGDDKEMRPVGEPVLLGLDWQRHFGGTPSPSVGCLEGSCRFENFRYQFERLPPPPPPTVVVVEREPAPEPDAEEKKAERKEAAAEKEKAAENRSTSHAKKDGKSGSANVAKASPSNSSNSRKVQVPKAPARREANASKPQKNKRK